MGLYQYMAQSDGVVRALSMILPQLVTKSIDIATIMQRRIIGYVLQEPVPKLIPR